MMRFSLKTAWIFLLPFSLFLYVACNKSGDTPDFSDPRGQQLTSLYENAVDPSHGAITTSFEELNEAIADFSSAPSESALANARSAWRAATQQWKRTEVYNFGVVSNFFLHTRIHRWPADIDGILNNINTDEEINLEYISRRGSSIIGLAAIEYLLFAEDAETTVATFNADEKRQAYLRGLADYLFLVGQEVSLRWWEERMAFTSNTELSIDGGQNVLVNGLVNQLDRTLRFRLRTPSGEDSGEAADPTLVETPFAAYSLPCLAAGFAEWKIAYYGGTDRTTSFGFDDYLSELGNTSVSPRIDAAISRIDANLASLEAEVNTTSLQELLTNNPSAVQQLTEGFQALLVLIRVDLSSTIGVILTVTDADGD